MSRNKIPDEIKLLLKAIRRIKYKYISCHDLSRNSAVLKYQTERSFAYELYHQWSKLLSKKIQTGEIQLSGEITKRQFYSSVTYPDLVLHGGQDNYNSQLLVCEIKREIPSVDRDDYKLNVAVLRDFNKIYHYINCKKEYLRYNYGVFIALNCNKCCLINYLKKILKEDNLGIPSKNMDRSTSSCNYAKFRKVENRLYCIWVEKANNDSVKISAGAVILSSILKNQKKCDQ